MQQTFLGINPNPLGSRMQRQGYRRNKEKYLIYQEPPDISEGGNFQLIIPYQAFLLEIKRFQRARASCPVRKILVHILLFNILPTPVHLHFWHYVSRKKEKEMKRLMIVLTVLFVFSISAFAQMGTGQGGGMMGGGWGWGMDGGLGSFSRLPLFWVSYL
ncbi:MAG: hypothetical protein ACYC69_17630 [Thermodesulfovibrionales bacterium]